MQHSQPQQLPYLQSERHFHLYQPYLHQIVAAWPDVVEFVPKPPVASVETLSSRIRICKTSLKTAIRDGLDWDTLINVAKFLTICDDIYVSTTAKPGKVVCGPYDRVRKMVPLGTQVESVIDQVVPKVNLKAPARDLVEAVIVLHHYKLLSEPSVVESSDDEIQQHIRFLEHQYDVAVEQDGNVFTIL